MWPFGKQKKQTESGKTLLRFSDVQVRPPTANEKEASRLLKSATSKHDKKDFDGAVNDLREAYYNMRKATLIYPIATYLRLPLYLQKAGRYHEALTEFDSLLKNTHDTRDITVIRNKMKLAAKREEKRKP